MTAEERLTRIEENLLVQTRLVESFERLAGQRLQALDTGQEAARQAEAEARQQAHDIELAEFRATVARVLDLLEGFISGQSGRDGH